MSGISGPQYPNLTSTLDTRSLFTAQATKRSEGFRMLVFYRLTNTFDDHDL
jgi:hypothetical protein